MPQGSEASQESCQAGVVLVGAVLKSQRLQASEAADVVQILSVLDMAPANINNLQSSQDCRYGSLSLERTTQLV